MDPVQVLWTAQLITEIEPNICATLTVTESGKAMIDHLR
jgi:hypothetical protein